MNPDIIERTENKTETKTSKKTAKPQMKGIYYLNDDTTHLEFVVESMIEVFDYSGQNAFNTVMRAHHNRINEFLVFKAAAPVVANKAKKLQEMIDKARETLAFEIRDETDDDDE